ncbi:hypothetical protein [Echinicola vietnamensis]|uniref:Uncharacterized protein n=1 Tax=Echinicola vietnamensis (strain DSM 17526 / LMG 23754 / KMM 6221) TaxID=926556 RepID=L0G225_ECHVK|nr:hypothetical protein [Echinicola vietnamensis]AGA80279.1 hypothetical protein Echvi_4072 [Echinicola vietnamensis DSM 17526]
MMENTTKCLFWLWLCLRVTALSAQDQKMNAGIFPAAEVEYVKLIDWKRFEGKSMVTDSQQLAGKLLLNANKYALTTWWQERGFSELSQHGYLDLKGISEHRVRPVAAEAEALAASLRLGLYDPASVGVSEHEAAEKTILLIKSLAHAHLANTENGWGREWQSALWAGYSAFAGWMMWDKLDDQTQMEVLKMIRVECEWIMHDKGLPQIKTYRNRHGEIISPGDTGSEENAWDGLILTVASAMMPAHPQQSKWMEKLIFLTLNATARPSDLESTQLVNGKPLREWLIGSNINEDGTAVNHHFIHPDYMTSVFEFNPIKYFWLADMEVSMAMVHNIDVVFGGFADLTFTAGETITGGEVKAPGGTIFIQGTGDIYYPLGTDWGEGRRMNFVMFNSIAAAFSPNPAVRKRAREWMLLQGQEALEMQGRFEDGHTYMNEKEDAYKSREAWVADKATSTYIIEALQLTEAPRFTNQKIK